MYYSLVLAVNVSWANPTFEPAPAGQLAWAGPGHFLKCLDPNLELNLEFSRFGAHEALFGTLWFQIQHQIIVYYYAEVPQSLKLVVIRVICDILNVKA